MNVSAYKITMVIVYFLLLLVPFSYGLAEEGPEAAVKLKVAVSGFDPMFTYKMDGKYATGFDVDLLKSLQKEYDYQYEYVPFNSAASLVEAVSDGKADIGISGVTITHERNKIVDFSQPYFDSGLQLAVNKEILNYPFGEKIKTILPVFGKALIVLFIMLTVFAHAVWFIEHLDDDDDNFHSNYFIGIAQAYWWALVTSTTVGYGDMVPQMAAGKLIASIVMIAGIMWFGAFAGTMGSIITIFEQDNTVYGLNDLVGRKVATASGSTAYDFIQSQKQVDAVAYDDIQDAYDALVDGEVDGVLFDYPAVISFASQHDNIVPIGDIIQPEQYGIVMSKGLSPEVREEIDSAILKFKENGQLSQIKSKWVEK